MSRNSLYSKNISYTIVEEYLDSVFEDEPVPMSVTNAIKKVTAHFQCNKAYTRHSIHDAVQDYYDNRFGGAAAIRNMRMAISNSSRDNSSRVRHTKPGWTMPAHQKEAIKTYWNKYRAAKAKAEEEWNKAMHGGINVK